MQANINKWLHMCKSMFEKKSYDQTFGLQILRLVFLRYPNWMLFLCVDMGVGQSNIKKFNKHHYI
jgi:hypothetical protein